MRIIYKNKTDDLTSREIISIYRDDTTKNILIVQGICIATFHHDLYGNCLRFRVFDDIDIEKLVKECGDKGFIDISECARIIKDN